MRTLKEILKDIAEARAQLEASEAPENIDELETRINSLIAERDAATATTEKRKALLGSIAGGALGTEVRKDALAANTPAEADDPHGTPEYRAAFYKSMTGRALSTAETRAMTIASDSAGPAVPTELNNMIVEQVKQIAPMVNEITLTRINGNVAIAVESEIADAKAHTENAAITSDVDKLLKITLNGYEITKLVSISKTVASMTQANFESWIVSMIAKRIARKLEKYIINGTGANEPTGIAASNVWDTTNSISVAKASDLSTANVLAFIALLNGEYDYNAKIVMSKKTLFTDFMPLQDRNKNDIVKAEGKNYFVYGYPVLQSDSVALHDAYLGSLTEMYGNLAQDITIESNRSSGFRQNAVDYLGSAIFDCKPAVKEAFVKLTKAAV